MLKINIYSVSAPYHKMMVYCTHGCPPQTDNERVDFIEKGVIHPSPIYYPVDTKLQSVNGFIYCFNCCGMLSVYFILFQVLVTLKGGKISVGKNAYFMILHMHACVCLCVVAAMCSLA